MFERVRFFFMVIAAELANWLYERVRGRRK